MRTILLTAVLALLGCGRATLEPPVIQQDRTACEQCRMLVSETQYAAAYFDGQAGNDGYHIFDDIGCRVRKLRAVNRASTVQKIWVHDLPGNAWLASDSATFVYSSHINTPMNYGYVAFRDPRVAEQYASQHNGHVIRDYNAMVQAMQEIAK